MKTSSHNDDADSRREHIIDSDQIPSKHSDTSSLVSNKIQSLIAHHMVKGSPIRGPQYIKKLEQPRETPKGLIEKILDRFQD